MGLPVCQRGIIQTTFVVIGALSSKYKTEIYFQSTKEGTVRATRCCNNSETTSS